MTAPTTVRLPPGLRAEAESYAELVGCSLSGLVGVALRDYLDARRRPLPAALPSALPSSRGLALVGWPAASCGFEALTCWCQHWTEGAAKRSVLVRIRQEVQEVPRGREDPEMKTAGRVSPRSAVGST